MMSDIVDSLKSFYNFSHTSSSRISLFIKFYRKSDFKLFLYFLFYFIITSLELQAINS